MGAKASSAPYAAELGLRRTSLRAGERRRDDEHRGEWEQRGDSEQTGFHGRSNNRLVRIRGLRKTQRMMDRGAGSGHEHVSAIIEARTTEEVIRWP
jgi:hypothetical protein